MKQNPVYEPAGSLVGLRFDQWKLVFAEQRAGHHLIPSEVDIKGGAA